ncbi:hypothetical protein QNI16_24110 [Cytophagaceae bacterium YF14B1]|uniref:Uncharacterized protein n=1 Tax=Xanthocytophaga flava TaxID=3048013 RepID=A0AAE3QUB3_9BACT|nr:hypothetical protein [Xanthocytophaga flavus]MDJ1483605.1 hypothetical protein [Xanthocytophaga flavus]
MQKIIFTLLLFGKVLSSYCQLSDKTTDSVKTTQPSLTLQSSPASGFQSYNSFTKLSATNDGLIAEGNINYRIKSSWNLNTSISTPVASKTQRVKPLTIAGLSNNSSFTIGTQKIWWGTGFAYDAKKYNEAIKAVGKDMADFKYDDLTPEEQRIFDRKAKIQWGVAWYGGLKFGVEQQDFEYITDTTSFLSQTDSKAAVKLTATVGALTSIGIFALSFTHTAGYQTDDPIKYYVPVNSTGVLVEKNLSSSAPTRQTSNRVRIEYLSSGYHGKLLRINPNINLDLNQELFSFEFPVYFLTSDKERANFNGGIFTGYVSDKGFAFNTDKNNFVLGVFLGANFTNLFQ